MLQLSVSPLFAPAIIWLRIIAIAGTCLDAGINDYLSLNIKEVHNSVCMNQDLSRRCIWIQESNNTAASNGSESLVSERENRRRVTAVQKTLKVSSFFCNNNK